MIILFLVCSIGSLGRDKSEACAKNITVRDSVIKQSDNGLRIKTWQGGSGAVSKINFNNIEMDKVKNYHQPILASKTTAPVKLLPS